MYWHNGCVYTRSKEGDRSQYSWTAAYVCIVDVNIFTRRKKEMHRTRNVH